MPERNLKLIAFQPEYPKADIKKSKECLNWCREQLRGLRPGFTDLIVLPEYITVPGIEHLETALEFYKAEGRQFENLLVSEARRLDAYIAFGTLGTRDTLTNRTVIVGPDGNREHYDKIHLTEVESDSWYVHAGDTTFFTEIRGYRVSIAVCFDMYFPEYFAALAKGKPDLIIIPSYQRSEEGFRLLALSSARAIDTGAHIVRSSYSMPAINGDRGGHTCHVAPDGRVIHDLSTNTGMLVTEVKAGSGFYKPASYGAPEVLHRDLIERRRGQALYPADPAPFRICAHRGLSSACPENTLPAFGAALGTGADEIELDLWLSADGVPVVCHDPDLARTTDIGGIITELSWEEIQKADAGIRTGDVWAGVDVPRFEEVVSAVAGLAVINIHIKDPGRNGELVGIVADVINAGVSSGYIAGDEAVLDYALALCPELERCCLAAQNDSIRQVDIASEYRCTRVQFGRSVLDEAIVAAKAKDLTCNLFWSDELTDARQYVGRGIDVLLTNRCHIVRAAALSM